MTKFIVTYNKCVSKWAEGYRLMRLNERCHKDIGSALTATYAQCPYKRVGLDGPLFNEFCDGAKCAAEEMGLKLPTLRIFKERLNRVV